MTIKKIKLWPMIGVVVTTALSGFLFQMFPGIGIRFRDYLGSCADNFVALVGGADLWEIFAFCFVVFCAIYVIWYFLPEKIKNNIHNWVFSVQGEEYKSKEKRLSVYTPALAVSLVVAVAICSVLLIVRSSEPLRAFILVSHVEDAPELRGEIIAGYLQAEKILNEKIAGRVLTMSQVTGTDETLTSAFSKAITNTSGYYREVKRTAILTPRSIRGIKQDGYFNSGGTEMYTFPEFSEISIPDEHVNKIYFSQKDQADRLVSTIANSKNHIKKAYVVYGSNKTDMWDFCASIESALTRIQVPYEQVFLNGKSDQRVISKQIPLVKSGVYLFTCLSYSQIEYLKELIEDSSINGVLVGPSYLTDDKYWKIFSNVKMLVISPFDQKSIASEHLPHPKRYIASMSCFAVSILASIDSGNLHEDIILHLTNNFSLEQVSFVRGDVVLHGGVLWGGWLVN